MWSPTHKIWVQLVQPCWRLLDKNGQTDKQNKQSIFFVLLEDVTLLGNETFEIKVNPLNLKLITKQKHSCGSNGFSNQNLRQIG